MGATAEAMEPAARPELARFSPSDAAIAEMASQFMPLRVEGIDDKVGFVLVHTARMVVKAKRVAVEKTRVDLKADALAYGRAVDGEAKRLTDLMQPIEDHLEEQEMAVVREKARIAKEAEDAKRAALQVRLDAFAIHGAVVNPLVVAEMSESAFQDAIGAVKAVADERARVAAEAARIEAEQAAARKAEQEALIVERERLAEIARTQNAEAERIRAEQKRLDDSAWAMRRAAEIEAAKAEAAERSRIETEQRIAREAAQAEAEAAREAAERPYRVQLLMVADAVTALTITVPNGPKSDEVRAILNDAAEKIRTIAKNSRRRKEEASGG